MQNNNFFHVLADNVSLILSGICGWVLTFVGVDSQMGFMFTGDGWRIVDWVLSHLALLLSCTVSLATLYKISREMNKKGKGK